VSVATLVLGAFVTTPIAGFVCLRHYTQHNIPKDNKTMQTHTFLLNPLLERHAMPNDKNGAVGGFAESEMEEIRRLAGQIQADTGEATSLREAVLWAVRTELEDNE
jgi:hypothetical protein